VLLMGVGVAISVADDLIENAELIANAVPERRGM
jgi:hypothetical protein